jgi:glutamyl/glutaminyl-tRNA synthetase
VYLEFQDNRRLYDWVLDNISIPVHPRQYEFSRLNLEYTVMSKRKLNQLVTEKHVKAGMTRVCRPSPVCVVVATPPIHP